MKTTIAYKIEIDYDKDTVTLKEQGRRTPLSEAYQVTASNTAQAARQAAYYLLERAYFIENSMVFYTPPFNNDALTGQVRKMETENTLSIFKEA